MNEVEKQPDWLPNLENKKQKSHLAHEAGAGAPCMICNSLCPGLDLHFWRKICKNCKCSRDDHEVDVNEFPQFELLFGASKNSRVKSTVLHLNAKLQSDKGTAFEWIPPNITKELATDYMKSLPEDKLPIKGSAGAALRKQQLQKQLPLHDIDHKVCDSLSDQEKHQFQKYLENIKQYVGQGNVTKLLGAQPFDRTMITPANATDMKQSSPSSKLFTNSPSIQLRTPSSFLPKQVGKTTPLDTVKFETLQNESNSNIVTSQQLPAALMSSSLSPRLNSKFNHNNSNLVGTDMENNDSDTSKNNSLISNYNRHDKIVGSTLDEGKLSYIREKLSNKYNAQELLARADHLNRKEAAYSTPLSGSPNRNININHDNVENINKSNIGSNQLPLHSTIDRTKHHTDIAQSSYAESLGPNSSSTINTPRCIANARMESFKTPSNVFYSDAQHNQIFPQEINEFSKQEDSSNIGKLTNMVEELTMGNEKKNCTNCREPINCGEVIVTAERAKNEAWHPGCFTCSVCKELLVDLVYFYYKNQLYCGRDFAALLEIPRCYACDELIFVREYTVAEGHNYHVKHFCCWECDIPLAGQQYISENDRPFCLPCYEKVYAKNCDYCKHVIAPDEQGVAIKDLNFHARESCFCCFECKKGLLNSKMAVKENKLFCSRECITKFLNSK